MAWGSHVVSRMRTYDYTELDVWKRAVDLAVAVYSFSAALPLEERYGLTGQARRAAVSVPANIAEGQRRSTDGEFLNQLSVANGSLGELETHVVSAERLGLVTRGEARGILDRSAEVGRLANGLSRS
jgi:four helix bundle protein